MKRYSNFSLAARYLTSILGVGIVAINSLFAQMVGENILATVHYRSIGPTRASGRFVDFAVYERKPTIFYAALASGGLWKTTE
jgi:hypothetical protein